MKRRTSFGGVDGHPFVHGLQLSSQMDLFGQLEQQGSGLLRHQLPGRVQTNAFERAVDAQETRTRFVLEQLAQVEVPDARRVFDEGRPRGRGGRGSIARDLRNVHVARFERERMREVRGDGMV
eukprot:scaffold772_cov339-Pavlova_lutheri.AAC.59